MTEGVPVTTPHTTQETATSPAGESPQVAGAATSAAGEVAGTAATATGEVVGTAKEQAGHVLEESLVQAKDLAAEVRSTLTDQLHSQSERLTDQLHGLSGQLTEGDTSGVVGQAMTEAGQRLRALADRLQRTGPEGVLADLRSYARRNPGSFLLAAAAAGLVTGRLVKGMSAGSTGTQGEAGTSTGRPTAGVEVPTGMAAGGAYPPATPLDPYGAVEPPLTGVAPGGVQ
jgi:hypothetical protein